MYFRIVYYWPFTLILSAVVLLVFFWTQTHFLAFYLRKRMIESVLWMVPLNSFSMEIIFNFLWFCQIRYGLDMILLSINQLWKPNSFSHPLRDWFKSEIISRNLFIGQVGDTTKWKNIWNKSEITGQAYREFVPVYGHGFRCPVEH